MTPETLGRFPSRMGARYACERSAARTLSDDMDPTKLEQIAALFEETARAHHQAFIETDGVHAEWAAWYAERLAPRFSDALGQPVDPAALADALIRWDVEHRSSGSDEPWPKVYAIRLLERDLDPV